MIQSMRQRKGKHQKQRGQQGASKGRAEHRPTLGAIFESLLLNDNVIYGLIVMSVVGSLAVIYASDQAKQQLGGGTILDRFCAR